ncbi:MAG: hypothetical protein KQH53_10430 [Desulfarculaceae bacterium]|nr:hypothetical protein [Desulfarculaceae bacterium]
MLQRGSGNSPTHPRRRALAWLLVGFMLYAGGLGHLLHPWLHEHGPRHAHPSGGLHAQALAESPAHGPCALCAFLAHFLAKADAALAGVAGSLACLGQAFPRGEGPLATADRRLCASRSPPRQAVV